MSSSSCLSLVWHLESAVKGRRGKKQMTITAGLLCSLGCEGLRRGRVCTDGCSWRLSQPSSLLCGFLYFHSALIKIKKKKKNIGRREVYREDEPGYNVVIRSGLKWRCVRSGDDAKAPWAGGRGSSFADVGPCGDGSTRGRVPPCRAGWRKVGVNPVLLAAPVTATLSSEP